MTKQRLEALKHITTWGGVLITLSGIALNWNSGGNLLGRCLSLAGVIITCCGHIVTNAISRHQRAEKDAAAKRLADLEDSLDDAHSRLNDPILKRIVEREAWDEAIAARERYK